MSDRYPPLLGRLAIRAGEFRQCMDSDQSHFKSRCKRPEGARVAERASAKSGARSRLAHFFREGYCPASMWPAPASPKPSPWCSKADAHFQGHGGGQHASRPGAGRPRRTSMLRSPSVDLELAWPLPAPAPAKQVSLRVFVGPNTRSASVCPRARSRTRSPRAIRPRPEARHWPRLSADQL